MRTVQIDGPMIWARMEFEEWPPDEMEVRCKSTALWDALDGIFLTLNDAVRRYPDDTWPTDVVRMWRTYPVRLLRSGPSNTSLSAIFG